MFSALWTSEQFVRFLFRWRFPILGGLTLAALPLCLIAIRRSDNEDNNIKVWLQKADPQYLHYRTFKDTFENDDSVVLAFQCEDVFTPKNLGYVDALTQRLANIQGLERVTSLMNVQVFDGTPEGLIVSGKLLKAVPNDPSVMERVRKRAMGDPLYAGNLVSQDGKTAAIFGRLINTEDAKVKAPVVERVKAMIRSLPPGFPKVYVSGSAAVDYEYDSLAAADFRRFTAITFGVIVVILYLFFRKVSIAIIPTCIQVLAILIVLGIYLATGASLNMIVNIVVPIMMAVCVTDSVHLFSEFYALSAAGHSIEQAIVGAIKNEWRPCLYTVLASAIDFLSFLGTPLRPLTHLGLITAMGMFLAYGLTMVLIPIFASFFKSPPQRAAEARQSGWVIKMMKAIARVVLVHYRSILVIMALITLLGGLGILRIQVQTDVLKFMPKNHYIRRADEFIEKAITPVNSFEIVLKGPSDHAKDPDFLKRVEALETFMQGLPGVTRTFSLLNYLKQIHQALRNGDPAFYRIPDSREAVAQFLLLAESSGDRDIARYVNYDYSTVRIQARAKRMSDEILMERIERLERYVTENFATEKGESGVITGLLPLYAWINRYIVRSQIQSFGIAFLMTALFMILMTRSIRVGLWSLWPNISPILITLGLMGYWHIPLDAATTMIAGIVMGIIVDDTIHYLEAYKERREKGGDTFAVLTSHESVGSAMLTTSMILSAGFGVLCFSQFKPVFHFGLLTAFTLVVGALGDFFGTPSILLAMRPFDRGKRPPPLQAEQKEA